MKTKPSHITSASCKLTCILALLLIFCISPHAAQQLDIRSYEASDECDMEVKQIRVTVNGVSFGGILTVSLYDDPNHFLS